MVNKLIFLSQNLFKTLVFHIFLSFAISNFTHDGNNMFLFEINVDH